MEELLRHPMQELLQQLDPNGILDGAGVKKLLQAVTQYKVDPEGPPTMLSQVRVTSMGPGGCRIPYMTAVYPAATTQELYSYPDLAIGPRLMLLRYSRYDSLNTIAAGIASIVNDRLRPIFLECEPPLKRIVVLFWRDIHILPVGVEDTVVLALNYGIGVERQVSELPDKVKEAQSSSAEG